MEIFSKSLTRISTRTCQRPIAGSATFSTLQTVPLDLGRR
jgi:hypothetical protein